MYYLSFITKLSINNQRTASIKHLTVATHQQFYLSSQQMLQNSTCRTHDSLLKCNLRRHTFLEKLWFLVRENTDRNILAYHLKKKIQCTQKKGPRSSRGQDESSPNSKLAALQASSYRTPSPSAMYPESANLTILSVMNSHDV